MRRHQTIRNNLCQWNDIFPHSTQKIQVIHWLKENALAVIAAIVDVIVQTLKEGCLSARHG